MSSRLHFYFPLNVTLSPLLNKKNVFALITSVIPTITSAEVCAGPQLEEEFTAVYTKQERKLDLNVNKLTFTFNIQDVRTISKLFLSIALRNGYTVRGRNLSVVLDHRKWLEITGLTVALRVRKQNGDHNVRK
jgi:hypothetical protein